MKERHTLALLLLCLGIIEVPGRDAYAVGHDDGAHHAGAEVALLAWGDKVLLRHGGRVIVGRVAFFAELESFS